MQDKNYRMVSDTEDDVSSILTQLSQLKTNLHNKISLYIESIEQKEFSGQKDHEDQTSKSFDSDMSFVTDTLSNKVSSDHAQIKFISDYIKTLTKNIEEIMNSLTAFSVDNDDISITENKLNDIKVLERHLNRNEPLIKEIEFWLSHDFSKPDLQKNDTQLNEIRKEFNSLRDAMSNTNAILVYKKQLLTKQVKSRENTEILKRRRSSSCKKRNAKTSCSSSEGYREQFSDEEIQRFYDRKRVERKKLLKDIEDAKKRIQKLSSILDIINQEIEDNRFISITNDALVSQQGYAFGAQLDLLKTNQKDLEWLIDFTQPEKLCKSEIPDDILIKITDLKVNWNLTKDRIINAQETLSKIRELWILFEYYIVRIMLWNKAVVLNQDMQKSETIKNEAEAIKKKIYRIKKIKSKLFGFISDFSKKIIEKLWRDTENEFESIYRKL